MELQSITARVQVSSVAASALATAARKIAVSDAELACDVRQDAIMAEVRAGAPHAFDSLVDDVRDQLRDRSHFAVVRGLDIRGCADTLLVALSRSFGVIVEPYRAPWSRYVRRVVAADSRTAGGRALNELLHTDGTDWSQPNDFTFLLSVVADQQGGGASRLMDAETAFNVGIDALRSDWGALTCDLPWRIADELDEGQVHWAPVADIASGLLRWLRFTVEAAAGDGVAWLDADQRVAINRFERALESSDACCVGHLVPGDLLVVDNRRCLHARTAVERPAASRRLLLRTKVMQRDGG